MAADIACPVLNIQPGKDHVSQPDTYEILNAALFVPFDERTTLSLSASRFVRAASLPNYEFTNNSAMVGVSWRF